MTGPGVTNSLRPISPVGQPTKLGPAQSKTAAGEDFAALIKEQLQTVSRMQSEADEKVQQLLTGQTQNLTEVFTAARKAEVAFSLLMEIRNKLVDAYQEVKNMRV